MPNRMIKAAIHESEDVSRMTDFQFRLWVNLITYVDDHGRGDARPAIIKGNCFPLRERVTLKDISDALSALAGMGCISLYDVDGKSYLCFPTWDKHQKTRSDTSKYPAPPKTQAVADSCKHLQTSANICQQMQTNVPVNENENVNVNDLFVNENGDVNENENDVGSVYSDAISLLEQNKQKNRALARRAYLEKINAQASERTLTELDAFAEAMGGDVCAAAMDIALKAHKGTWPYVRGILRHAKEAGVMCLPEFEEYQTKGTISDE